jgi:hypothetical protein
MVGRTVQAKRIQVAFVVHDLESDVLGAREQRHGN